MQMLKKRKSIKYIVLCIALLLCITIAILSGAHPYNTAVDIPITPMADAALKSNYSAFEDGSRYMYTDISKVETAHNDPTKSDTSTIVVDREQSHGSLQNPYVINSLTQWNYFAANTGASDVDKVFVLGSDITFTSTNFTPVRYFYGKFYGGGHTFHNVTYNFGANNDCGVFRVLHANGVIADLNLDNVNITSTGGRVGSLVGTTNGGDVLNCHAKGSVAGVASYPASGTVDDTAHYPVGGLIGRVNGDGIKVYIYRCSVDVNLIVTPLTQGASSGGILGGFTATNKTTSSNIWDCLSIVNLTVVANATNDTWYGGITNYVGFIGDQSIENCLTFTNAIDYTTYRVSFGSLFNGWAGGITGLTLKNVFSDSVIKFNNRASEYPSTNSYSLYGGIWYSGYYSSAAQSMTLKTSNVNWYADKTIAGTFAAPPGNGIIDLYTYRSIANTKYTGTAGLTQTDMYNKAQGSLPSNIWMQKSNITPAFMSNTDVTSTAGYTVEKAPNRNTNIKTGGFSIKYVNLENGAEKEYEGNATTYNHKDTTQLYTPTAKDSNHIFIGWTLDNGGEGAIYKNIPIDLYGDVTMYAVWDVPQASVTKENIISAESNGTFSKEYSQDSSLTMRGEISVTSMTSPTIQYKWHKNGDTTILGTSSTYSISNVADTGDYVLDYVITDSVEPLWRHRGSTIAQHAEITPGQLFVKDKSFIIDPTTPEYMGKRLKDIKFSITMVDSMDREVDGAASWQTGINQVQEGTNKEKITFSPTNINYTLTGVYEVEFQAKYITLTFNMPDVSDKIVANMTYQQTYTTNNVVQSFYNEYSERLENNPRYASLKNMTPMFDGVKITEYSGEYINVQTSQEIQVEFVDATYTVTFNPNNGEKPFTNTSPIYYNNRITPPDIPVNGDKVFLGWYFDDITVDSTGVTVTTNRAWNFDSDFVTSDLILTAKWLDAVLDLIKLEVTAEKDSYTATEQLKAEDLKVTAHYEGEVEGYGTVKQEVELLFGQYEIEYENNVDNALHVGQGNITVKYTYKGETKVANLSLPVVAKKIDTSGLTFSDKTVTYTGETVAIDKIRGILPDEIVGVRYVYTKNGIEVSAADVKDIGTYIVQAIFDMD